MTIEYVIINFIILLLILIIFGRKMVMSIFKSRKDRINKELDEIEKIENTEMPELEKYIPEEIDTENAYDVLNAKQNVNAKISQIKDFGKRECHEIHRDMIENATKELFFIMKNAVTRICAEEAFHKKIREAEEGLVEEILSQIKLTPGDLTYLKHSDVLYVTLTSAFELSAELVQRIENVVTEMLNKVDGKISLWVLQDSSLIGGLKLRIGDTVYDATISEELYRFKKSLDKEPILDDDAASELINKFVSKAERFIPKIHIYQLGRVMAVSDGICWMDGLADIMYGEVIEFECGERGMVLDIQQNRIGCVIFGKYEHIESGSRVRRVGRIASVPVGEELLGRVVDAMGTPIDGEGYLYTKERRPIEFKAPGILDRAPVDKPLQTGIKAIDALVPIGKGQRELIIGDRQTGKTAIAVDTIINQKGKNTICIYVAIGQKETLITEIREKLKANGALEYTIIVAVPASGSAALQYIAPFSGAAMGEYFMYSSRDVLIVYDDLSKHAVAYRELSLLLHRPSGREAYPGDIFYLHSRLLERSAHLSKELGGGSMTALPIIETLAGDISAYIPTNVISITDGQIFLETDLFNEGQRPAVNVGLSVSRVGGAAQTRLMKQVSSSLRTRLAQYRELADFMQFGSDIDDTTKQTLDSGKMLMESLRQKRYNPIPDALQAILIFAVSRGYAKNAIDGDMERFERDLFDYILTEQSALYGKLSQGEKMDSDTQSRLEAALDAFVQRS